MLVPALDPVPDVAQVTATEPVDAVMVVDVEEVVGDGGSWLPLVAEDEVAMETDPLCVRVKVDWEQMFEVPNVGNDIGRKAEVGPSSVIDDMPHRDCRRSRRRPAIARLADVGNSSRLKRMSKCREATHTPGLRFPTALPSFRPSPPLGFLGRVWWLGIWYRPPVF